MIDTERLSDELKTLTREWEIEGALFVLHEGKMVYEEVRAEGWEGNAEDLRFFLHSECEILLYEAAVIHEVNWNSWTRENLVKRFGSVEKAIQKAAEKAGARTMFENRQEKAFETGIRDLAALIRSTRAKDPAGRVEKTEGWTMLRDGEGDCSVAVYLDAAHETAMIHFSLQPEQILLNEQHLLTYFRLELRRIVDAYLLRADEAQLVPFTEENMDGACRLELEDAQYEFILDARSCICRAYALRDKARTYVLESCGRAVGLAVLLQTEDTEIDAFLIDRRYQRRGFGDRMLEMLLDMLKKEGCETLLLGCAEENTAAVELYRKHGFLDTESKEEGLLLRKEL